MTGIVPLSVEELESSKIEKLATVAKSLRGMAALAPSLFVGLNPSAPAKSLAPLLIRMENAGLIEFEDSNPPLGDLAKRHPKVLIDAMEAGLKTRLLENPGWTFVSEKPEPIDLATLEWGLPPKTKSLGDSPPEDDPRFGTW